MMAGQQGRDFLLKAGDGATPVETFQTLGAARVVSLSVNNNPVDNTTMQDNGVQHLVADAGVQSMQVTVDGLFKDSVAEEILRDAALNRLQKNYQLFFPNGDSIEAAFIVTDYRRAGRYDDLESFSATLIRSGTATFTAAE